MKLPDLSVGARPSLAGGGGVSRYQPQDLGSAVAPGAALADLGVKISKMAAEEEDRVAVVRAEDAFNQLRQRQQDLTYGEAGFVNHRGGEAITKPLLKDYTGQFDEVTNQIAETLSTPKQKEMFRRRSAVSSLEFRDDLMRHILREGDAYEEQTFKGTVAVERANVSTHWNEPDAVALSKERIDAMVRARAERKGWDETYVEAIRQQELGNLHESVIDQALAAKDYVYAEKWFDDHRDEMDQPTRDRLAPRVENGVQKQLVNGYNTEYLAQQDNFKALGALEKRITGDEVLGDEPKNMLLGRLQSRQEVLLNRYEREQRQREQTLERGITAVNALTMQGFEPTAEQMAPLVNSARGTPYEPLVKQMIATADQTRRFRLATPAQQEAFLTQAEVAARKDPTKADVTMLGKLRSIKDAQGELLKKDPTSFAIRQGLIAPEDEAAKPIDLTKPEAMGKQLEARFSLMRSMQGRYNAAPKPLTEAESSLLTSFLGAATAQQKRDYLGRLASATANDRVGYKALLGQIAPDDPVTAVAGLRALQNPIVSDLMLQGQAILRPDKKEDGTPGSGKLWPMPKPADFDKAFENLEDDAFAGHPAARNDYYQAAISAYAALAAKAGDASGTINRSRFRAAFDMATGGVTKYNGRAVVLPYGTDVDKFEDGMAERLQSVVNSGLLHPVFTMDYLENLPLEPVGEGRYRLVSGDGVVVYKDKKPVVIDFNGPMNFQSDLVGKIPK